MRNKDSAQCAETGAMEVALFSDQMAEFSIVKNKQIRSILCLNALAMLRTRCIA
jgi:hypothetical protein